MKTVTVSNVHQLRRAAADPTVEVIRVDPAGTYRIRKPIVGVRRHNLTIDFQGATIEGPSSEPPTRA